MEVKTEDVSKEGSLQVESAPENCKTSILCERCKNGSATCYCELNQSVSYTMEHSVQKLTCGICKKQFTSLDDLEKHATETHSDNPEMKESPSIPENNCMLLLTQASHHGHPPDIEEQTPINDDILTECSVKNGENTKIFKCKHCHKFFKFVYALKKHYILKHKQDQQTNLNEKNSRLQGTGKQAKKNAIFTCPECNKTFKLNATLQRHLLTKHGLSKNYQPQINKIAIENIDGEDKDQDKKGRSLRKDKKSIMYVCPICYRSFKRKDNLKLHIFNVHGKNLGINAVDANANRSESKSSVPYEANKETSTVSSNENGNTSDNINTQKENNVSSTLSQHQLMLGQCQTKIVYNASSRTDDTEEMAIMNGEKIISDSSENLICKLCNKKIMSYGSLRRHCILVHSILPVKMNGKVVIKRDLNNTEAEKLSNEDIGVVNNNTEVDTSESIDNDDRLVVYEDRPTCSLCSVSFRTLKPLKQHAFLVHGKTLEVRKSFDHNNKIENAHENQRHLHPLCTEPKTSDSSIQDCIVSGYNEVKKEMVSEKINREVNMSCVHSWKDPNGLAIKNEARFDVHDENDGPNDENEEIVIYLHDNKENNGTAVEKNRSLNTAETDKGALIKDYQELMEENDEGAFCHICNKLFSCYSSLRRHNITVHKYLPKSKEKCDNDLDREACVKKKISVLPGETTCPICWQVFKKLESLKMHAFLMHEIVIEINNKVFDLKKKENDNEKILIDYEKSVDENKSLTIENDISMNEVECPIEENQDTLDKGLNLLNKYDVSLDENEIQNDRHVDLKHENEDQMDEYKDPIHEKEAPVDENEDPIERNECVIDVNECQTDKNEGLTENKSPVDEVENPRDEIDIVIYRHTKENVGMSVRQSSSSNNLGKEKDKHVKKLMTTCHICNRSFYNWPSLRRHNIIVHKYIQKSKMKNAIGKNKGACVKKKMFLLPGETTCPICSQVFKKLESLKMHAFLMHETVIELNNKGFDYKKKVNDNKEILNEYAKSVDENRSPIIENDISMRGVECPIEENEVILDTDVNLINRCDVSMDENENHKDRHIDFKHENENHKDRHIDFRHENEDTLDEYKDPIPENETPADENENPMGANEGVLDERECQMDENEGYNIDENKVSLNGIENPRDENDIVIYSQNNKENVGISEKQSRRSNDAEKEKEKQPKELMNNGTICRICNKSFANGSSLKRHYIIVHNHMPKSKKKGRNIEGVESGELDTGLYMSAFSEKNGYDGISCEVKKISMPSYQKTCPICAKEFKKHETMKSHAFSVHKTIIEFTRNGIDWSDDKNGFCVEQGDTKCYKCNKTLSCTSSLKRHLICVHNFTLNENSKTNEADTNKKPADNIRNKSLYVENSIIKGSSGSLEHGQKVLTQLSNSFTLLFCPICFSHFDEMEAYKKHCQSIHGHHYKVKNEMKTVVQHFNEKKPDTRVLWFNEKSPDTEVLELNEKTPDTEVLELNEKTPHTEILEFNEEKTLHTEVLELNEKTPDTEVLELNEKTPHTEVLQFNEEAPDTEVLEFDMETASTEVLGINEETPDTGGLQFKEKTSETGAKMRETEVEQMRITKVCKICNKEFKTLSTLRMHMFVLHKYKLEKKTKKTGYRFQCSFCPKVFNRTTYRAMHERIHTDDRPFMCHICGKSFTTKGIQNRHIETHFEVGQWTCDICNKKYRQERTLKLHVHGHFDYKPFKCNKCEKRFQCEKQLNRHQKTHEISIKTQCEICGVLVSNIKQHMHRHGRREMVQCSICFKNIMKIYMKSHMRRAHGEKQCYCRQCGRYYSRESTLYCHRLSHNVEKEHKCHICPKRFETSLKLRCHLNVHFGVKPYVCEICGKRSADKSNYYKHKKIHQTE